jgi:hypothetical protein
MSGMGRERVTLADSLEGRKVRDDRQQRGRLVGAEVVTVGPPACSAMTRKNSRGWVQGSGRGARELWHAQRTGPGQLKKR